MSHAPLIHGWLILDKPPGVTSAKVLRDLKSIIGRQKMGHLGTLDTLATGVLPVALGEATKLIPYIKNNDKTYEFSVHWGERRSTGDSSGELLEVSPVRPSEPEINAMIPEFMGELYQVPPVYSAIKIQGKRASDRVRDGETITLPPRPIHIYEFELLGHTDLNQSNFRITCSKGTYVRSIVEDFAKKLGTVGFASRIHRTKSGPFWLKQAISLETLAKDPLIGLLEKYICAIPMVLDDIPAIGVSEKDVMDLRQGRSLAQVPKDGEPSVNHQVTVLITDTAGKAIAIAEVKDGKILPKRVLNI